MTFSNHGDSLRDAARSRPGPDALAPGPRVREFTPYAKESLVSEAGGIALPLAALVIAAPLLYALARLWIGPNPLRHGSVLVTLGSLVLLALATIVVSAIRRLIVALAGGRPVRTATLHLDGGARPGTGLHGTLHLSWRLGAAESIRARLTCIVSTEGHEEWYVSQQFIWAQTVDGTACLPGAETRVPIAIPLPSEAPPSGTYKIAPHGARAAAWTLEATVLPDGPAFPHFVVAVAPTASGPAVVPDRLPTEEPSGAAPVRPAHSRVVVHRLRDGIDIRLPPPAGWRSLLVWVVVTAPLWIALPWLAWQDPRDWPGNLAVALVVPALINGVPLLVLLAPRRLIVRTGGVEIGRWPLRRHRGHVLSVRRVEVRAMPPVITIATDVWLHRGDEPHWFVYRGASQAEARWLAAEIGQALAVARETRSRGA